MSRMTLSGSVADRQQVAGGIGLAVCGGSLIIAAAILRTVEMR